MYNSLQPHGLQHASLPCPSLSPGVGLNSCPWSQRCSLTISSSAALFCCLQSFPASGKDIYIYIYIYIFGFSLYIAKGIFTFRVKHLPAMPETQVQSLGQEDPLDKGMATCSSVIAWRISMDRGAWWATVHGIAESDMTKRARAHTHTHSPLEIAWALGS